MPGVIVFIALREIRRSLGRFALLTGAVALLVVLLLFFQAVAGTLTLGLTGGIENNSADVIVYSERARRNPVASFLPPTTAAAVADVDGVAAASAVGRITVPAGPVGEAEQEDTVVVGLGDPSFGGPAELAEGRRAEAPGEAVTSGSSLADGFAIGDVIDAAGVELTVVGTADDAAFDVSPTLYVLFDDYASVVSNRAGAPIEAPVSWVAVRAADGADPADLAGTITAEVSVPSGDGVEALERSTAVAELPGVGQVTQSFNILYLLLYVVVTIVTGVFFLILTVQKQRSLVLFRAIGAGRSDVVKPVLVQVVLVVGLGCLLGIALAAGLLAVARDTFGSSLDPITTTLTVGFLLGLGVLASFGAVRRVLAIDPIDATTSGTI